MVTDGDEDLTCRLSAPPTEAISSGVLAEQVRRLQVLYKVGIALSAEANRERLMEIILLEAKALCNADGGTLYVRNEDRLEFAIMRTESLGIALGGTTGKPIAHPPLVLRDPVTGEPNLNNVATAAVSLKRSFNIIDAYAAVGFDFSGTKAFDRHNRYRSKSFLTIPLINQEEHVIGVLQLLNAIDPDTSEVTAFSSEHQNIVEALASQAAVALDNQLLLDGQKALLESFIKVIAAAIDAKSPYTGGHCERVPLLTLMLAESLCASAEGPFGEFQLNEAEWYELQIAAWLHDCGKVTTPVHVMDKATKLETIADRIEVVRARFETLKREAEMEHLRRIASDVEAAGPSQVVLEDTLRSLDDELAFLEHANIGGEFLSPEKQARVREIGRRPYREGGRERTLLSDDEVENLVISRGTLTQTERLVINAHMVQTLEMLESLPFPRQLRRVPEYAGGHHERMDGTGYPRGVFAGDLSIPARVMAIADVFEALTAHDRPYKPGKRLSEAMRIMGIMKRDNHLDPNLFDHFVRSGVYRQYAERYLPAAMVDAVDEAALLAIVPHPFTLPAEEERRRRRMELLPEYRGFRHSVSESSRPPPNPTHSEGASRRSR